MVLGCSRCDSGGLRASLLPSLRRKLGEDAAGAHDIEWSCKCRPLAQIEMMSNHKALERDLAIQLANRSRHVQHLYVSGMPRPFSKLLALCLPLAFQGLRPLAWLGPGRRSLLAALTWSAAPVWAESDLQRRFNGTEAGGFRCRRPSI